jgi:hypothetical protein
MDNYFSDIYKESASNNENGIIANYELRVVLMYEEQREQFVDSFVELFKSLGIKYTWSEEHLRYTIDAMFYSDVIRRVKQDYEFISMAKKSIRENLFMITNKGQIILNEENVGGEIFHFFSMLHSLLNFFMFGNKTKYDAANINYYAQIENMTEGHYFFQYYEDAFGELNYKDKKLGEIISVNDLEVRSANVDKKGKAENHFGKICKERAKIYLKALDLTKKKYTESQAFDMIAADDNNMDAVKLKKAFNKLKNEKFRTDPKGLENYLRERAKSR